MDFTEPPVLYIVIAVAVLLVGLLIAGIVRSTQRRRERERLQERYGSEYDRTVAAHGSKRAAVADLKEREQQREAMELRDLNPADLTLVRKNMAVAQYRFVENPADSMRLTRDVLTEVLRAKGYPVTDGDTASRVFSVDHPDHAATVRATLGSDRVTDVDTLRQHFLQARATIADITGTTFGPEDVTKTTSAPDDLRVEHTSPQQHTSDV